MYHRHPPTLKLSPQLLILFAIVVTISAQNKPPAPTQRAAVYECFGSPGCLCVRSGPTPSRPWL